MMGGAEKDDVHALGVPDREPRLEQDISSPDAPISENVNHMDPSQFPDGGRQAWLVVGGAFIGLIVSFGWINCK